MQSRAQFGKWCTCTGLLVLLITAPSLAQNRSRQNSPQPPREQRNEQHAPARPQPRPEPRNIPQRQFAPTPERRENRPYQPPTQGRHFGQWLNRHRDLPPDQQRRALQNDPGFRQLPRQRQQVYEQRLERFNSLPPNQQQQVLRRMQTWEHLTPQQKQDFRGMRQQFNSLPDDRRHAVRSAIEALRAMPPAARGREIQSGRFGQFSPQEKQILSDAARLPLAPREPDGSEQQSAPQTGPGRYVPRPPQ